MSLVLTFVVLSVLLGALWWSLPTVGPGEVEARDEGDGGRRA